jgi:hypothetical protein
MAQEQICPCEDVDRGPLGRVAEGERLGRVIMDKSKNRYISAAGKILPLHFRRRDICAFQDAVGISLLRLDRMSLEELKILIPKIIATKQGSKVKLQGLGVVLVDDLRKILDDVTLCRSLCVIDDPVVNDPLGGPDIPAHAAATGTRLTVRFIQSGPEDDAVNDELVRMQTLIARAFAVLPTLEDAYPV